MTWDLPDCPTSSYKRAHGACWGDCVFWKLSLSLPGPCPVTCDKVPALQRLGSAWHRDATTERQQRD